MCIVLSSKFRGENFRERKNPGQKNPGIIPLNILFLGARYNSKNKLALQTFAGIWAGKVVTSLTMCSDKSLLVTEYKAQPPSSSLRQTQSLHQSWENLFQQQAKCKEENGTTLPTKDSNRYIQSLPKVSLTHIFSLCHCSSLTRKTFELHFYQLCRDAIVLLIG